MYNAYQQLAGDRNMHSLGQTPAARRLTKLLLLRHRSADSVVQGGSRRRQRHNIIGDQPALLGTPGNYGGATQTIPLLPGSLRHRRGDRRLMSRLT